MQGFYYNEVNFNKLYNDVSILLSDSIIESSVAEGWLEDLYVSDRYNTTRAMEKYTSNIILTKLKKSSLTKDFITTTIDKRITQLSKHKTEVNSINDKLNTINKVKAKILNESLFNEIIDEFNIIESLEYLKEDYCSGNLNHIFDISEENVRNFLRVIETLKRLVRVKGPGSDEVVCIKEGIDRILYLYKELDKENQVSLNLGIKQGINVCEVDIMTCDDIRLLFVRLERMMETQTDYLLEYLISELKYIDKIIIQLEKELAPITESYSESDNYMKAISIFDSLVESIFFDESDADMNIKDLIRLQMVTEAIIEYESTLEASSRIITKGTDKTTRVIGNASAKSSGMSSTKSKVGQIKRGARIVDDRASSAINRKLDDIMNLARDSKREKIITGKNTVKLGKALKTIVTILGSSAIAKVTLGPVVGTATTIIGLLGSYALSKRTEEREKKRILLELETELKITKEKIEDAKGENAKEQKYQLMRIQANLEKEITRIKHGLRYY